MRLVPQVWMYLLILPIFASDNLKIDAQINEKDKTDDFIIREDGSMQSIEEARKQARGEANKLHRYDMKYYAGEYLIYDCKGRYFACVDKSSFEYCELARKKTRKEGHSVYACAHLKSFGTLTDCLEKQYELIHMLPSKLFCINTTPASETSKQAFSEITNVEEMVNQRLKEESQKDFLLVE